MIVSMFGLTPPAQPTPVARLLLLSRLDRILHVREGRELDVCHRQDEADLDTNLAQAPRGPRRAPRPRMPRPEKAYDSWSSSRKRSFVTIGRHTTIPARSCPDLARISRRFTLSRVALHLLDRPSC